MPTKLSYLLATGVFPRIKYSLPLSFLTGSETPSTITSPDSLLPSCLRMSSTLAFWKTLFFFFQAAAISLAFLIAALESSTVLENAVSSYWPL